MAIRQWNDPALGAGFENLAAAFAPPSGSDLSGYATAGATKAQADRLAWLFQNSSDPTASARSALTGVQGYGQTPAGFAATDATDRYGIDSAAASAANVAGINNEAALARQYAEPVLVNKDQTAYLPGQTQAATGLPAMFGGVVGAAPGETVAVPGQAEPMRGAPTMDTFKAAIMGSLPEPIQQAVASGMTSIEQVIMGDGSVQNQTALGAVGQTPYVKPEGVDVKNYITPDGRTGSAIVEPTGVIKDAATGEVLPEGTRTATTVVQGDATATSMIGKPTETSDKAGVFYNRAAPASANIDAAIGSGYAPTDLDYEATLGSISGLPNAATRHVISPEGRAFYNNAQNFMMAILRPDTGAAFGKDEFQSYARVFIPMPGDDANVIKEKAAARAVALTALQGTSRGAAEHIAALMQQNGLPIPPEMAAVMERNAAAPPAAPAGGPANGTVEEGFRYIGGPPGEQSSWQAVQ